MGLNKRSPIPLYYQLVEQLSEQIRAGELQPGQQLPSERELSDRHRISRMTVRQAIVYLVRAGTLKTYHGLGTFVAEPKLTNQASHLLGFTEAIMRRGGTVTSRVLEQAVIQPPPRVVAGLNLHSADRVLKIMRLRLSQGVPLLLETSYLPYGLCAGLEDADLATHSLYTVLREDYGVVLEHAAQTLEATIANSFEADLFGIERGAPMILLEGVATDRDNRPIEYVKAIYRADRFKFAFSSERSPALGLEFELAQVSVVLA